MINVENSTEKVFARPRRRRRRFSRSVTGELNPQAVKKKDQSEAEEVISPNPGDYAYSANRDTSYGHDYFGTNQYVSGQDAYAAEEGFKN